MKNAPADPAAAPGAPALADGPERLRLLAFTLLTWFALLGALLGNAHGVQGAAGHSAASPLQLQRLGGVPGAPRLSRRDGQTGAVVTSRAVAGQHLTARSSGDKDGSATLPGALPPLAALAVPAAVPTLAVDEPRPSPRRRAHLGRAPPASA